MVETMHFVVIMGTGLAIKGKGTMGSIINDRRDDDHIEFPTIRIG